VTIAPAQQSSQHAGPYAWYALAVLVLVYAINFIDRQVLSILAEDIKADMGLSDAQLGFLYGTAFAIFYTVFGLPLGRLADAWHRGRLMALGLAAWSLMTALSGFATSYAQLALARIGVGVGEASASPAAFSMLADYFPKHQRALAMAIYSSGVFVGLGLSLPLGGWIATTWNETYAAGGAPLGLAGWQAAFLGVGIPGLFVAAWVLSLREPMRGAIDGFPSPIVVPGAWRAFARELAAILPPFTFWTASRFQGGLRVNLIAALIAGIAAWLLIVTFGDPAQWISYAVGIYAVFSWTQVLRHTDPPTYALIWGRWELVIAVLGFGSLAYFTYAYGLWSAPYAIRTFGVGKDVAGLYLGIPGAVASALGVIVGGRLSDAWKARSDRARIYVSVLAVVLPLPFVWVMFHTAQFRTYYLLSPLVYMLSSLWVGSTVAAYQDFVLPRMRGIIGATYILGSTMVGLALGPYITGKVATVTGSLQTGMLSLFFVAPLSLVLLWVLARRAGDLESRKFVLAHAAGERLELERRLPT